MLLFSVTITFFSTLQSNVQNKCNIVFLITDLVIPRSTTSLGHSKDTDYHPLITNIFYNLFNSHSNLRSRCQHQLQFKEQKRNLKYLSLFLLQQSVFKFKAFFFKEMLRVLPHSLLLSKMTSGSCLGKFAKSLWSQRWLLMPVVPLCYSLPCCAWRPCLPHCQCYGEKAVVALGWPDTAFPLLTQPHMALAGTECSPDAGWEYYCPSSPKGPP